MERLAGLLGVFLIPLILTAVGIRAHLRGGRERRSLPFWLLMGVFWLITAFFWFFSVKTALDR